MNIKEAINILEQHQKWRLGAETPMLEPKVITNALNTLLEYAKKGIPKTKAIQLTNGYPRRNY